VAVSETVRSAVDTFGSLDIWVNNAGIYPVAAALDTTDEQWDAVHNINLRGAFVGAREAGREMVRAGRGGRQRHLHRRVPGRRPDALRRLETRPQRPDQKPRR
jgi:NAD(P)-dependent dehydrogenase (short-subunit alcohol dehydrogenase family)